MEAGTELHAKRERITGYRQRKRSTRHLNQRQSFSRLGLQAFEKRPCQPMLLFSNTEVQTSPSQARHVMCAFDTTSRFTGSLWTGLSRSCAISALQETLPDKHKPNLQSLCVARKAEWRRDSRIIHVPHTQKMQLALIKCLAGSRFAVTCLNPQCSESGLQKYSDSCTYC